MKNKIKLQDKLGLRELLVNKSNVRQLENYYIDIDGNWNICQSNVMSEYENENYIMTFKASVDFFKREFGLYERYETKTKLITAIFNEIDFQLNLKNLKV